MKLAIIDYNSGNLASAGKAFERAARESGVSAEIKVTNDPDYVAKADKVVLPGVGAYADCRRGLDAVDGMVDALEDVVRAKGRPFFGICVGHQLMAERGLEKEVTKGLGWIAGDVSVITPSDKTLKIPHMGWNTLNIQQNHALLNDLKTGPNGLHAYFVHSFHMIPSENVIAASADYAGDITAIVIKDNMLGTQFHPEKSQTLGLKLVGNFLKWDES